MRCNCCDRTLSEQEIHFNEELNAWEMCVTCLEISLDAAYSQGFSRDDDADLMYVVDEEYDDDMSYDSLSDCIGGFSDPWGDE